MSTPETEGGFSYPPFDEQYDGREWSAVTGAVFFDSRREIARREHHLPHWQQSEVPVFVTWRLADSLPKERLDQWTEDRAAWLGNHPKPWDFVMEENYHNLFSRQIDDWLDQGDGACVLRDPANANIVANALLHFHEKTYDLVSFVVMPNHVHVLFQPRDGNALGKIVKSWKGYTAREINRSLGVSGALWQDDYWDRLIRSERHFAKCLSYIRTNPQKAKLGDGEYVLF